MLLEDFFKFVPSSTLVLVSIENDTLTDDVLSIADFTKNYDITNLYISEFIPCGFYDTFERNYVYLRIWCY